LAVFFTADTHFGEHKTFELSRRPFPSLSTMDSFLITNWNNIITNKDTVYHLGDFGDPRILKLLNGQEIVLIPGNHDTKDIINRLQRDPRFRIGKTDEFYKPDHLFKMVHKPGRAKSLKRFYLYGHIHGVQKIKRNGLNVGIDCHNFMPIDFDTVMWWRNITMGESDGLSEVS